jgi:hypothetical protein
MDLPRDPIHPYVEHMFTVHCPNEQAEVLLGPRRIERLENTPDGIVLHWRCHCGATGALAPTGRAAEHRAAADRRPTDAANAVVAA